MWGKKLREIKIHNPDALKTLDDKEQQRVVSALEQARLMPYVGLPNVCVLDVLATDGKVGPRIRVRRHSKD